MTHKTLPVSASLTDFQKNLNQAAGKAGPKQDQQQHIFQKPGLRKYHEHRSRQHQADIVANTVLLIFPGRQQPGNLSGNDVAAAGQPDLTF